MAKTSNSNGLLKDNSAAVALVFGLALMVIVAAIGLCVDVARHYAVRSELQRATDAALLGAMKSIREIPNVEHEFTGLFFANYPRSGGGHDSWYMGSNIVNITVTSNVSREQREAGFTESGEYTAVVTAVSENLVMRIFGRERETITAEASAINNQESIIEHAELTFVLDTTGSMAGQPIADLKAAVIEALNVIFGANETIVDDPLDINLISYATSVAFSPTQISGMRDWVQSAPVPGMGALTWRDRYDWQQSVVNKVYLSNRNPDFPANPLYVDATDALPSSEETRFRTPIASMGTTVPPIPYVPGFGTAAYWCWDQESGNQQVASFFNKSKTPMVNWVNSLVAEGCTRINTGALWGLLSLSPNWQGRFSLAEPNLPGLIDERHPKYMVLMTDGMNTVFSQQDPTTSHDDVGTLAICNYIKSLDITLYTVTLGTSVNGPLMEACATSPAHYYHAPTSAQLRAIFQNLAIIIMRDIGLRLTR